MTKSISIDQNNSLENALKLARAGLPILPARIYQNAGSDKWQKSPMVSDWQNVATSNENQIREWWQAYPDAVPGIELGRAGLIVIDTDRHGGPDGIAAFQALAAVDGLPVGPVTITAGGGKHFFFRQPQGQRLGNRSGALPNGIDVKGAGGFVVAPGSVRPDGATYLAADDAPPLAESFPDSVPFLPTWIADLIGKVPAALDSPLRGSISGPAYAAAALEKNAAALASAPVGSRNNLLNATAFQMGRMVASGMIERENVIGALSQACIANGLAKDGLAAVEGTMESGLSAGMAKPLNERVRDPANDNRQDREGGDRGERKPTQAEMLIALAESAELFHAPDGTGYADLDINGHRETWPIRSKAFRRRLARCYFDATKGAPNSEAMQSALNMVEAKAHFNAPERVVHIRVGGLDGRLYLDLGDDGWRAVEIDAGGWRVVDRPPIRFRRSAGMKALPEPLPGGSLESLRSFVNVKSEQDFVLVVSWLLACLRNRGPYPVLVLSGEQGSAKSTLAAVLRSLVDPNTAPLRALPREDRDLFIAAKNAHVLAFDNVSGLPGWISDTLCRLATGSGFATRQLFTDDDEVLFEAARPVVLNGIEDFVTRPDLADRSLILTLEPIPEEQRRTEEELWTVFSAQRPHILGVLLDAVAKGLAMLPHTRLGKAPRMADFALWATACETTFWSAGAFMSAYSANRAEAVETVIEADAVAVAVRALMATRTVWTGTAAELLALLSAEAGESSTRSKAWPASPQALSGRLRRAATFLRKTGIEIGHSREGHDRARKIRISRAPVGLRAAEVQVEQPSSSASFTSFGGNEVKRSAESGSTARVKTNGSGSMDNTTAEFDRLLESFRAAGVQ